MLWGANINKYSQKREFIFVSFKKNCIVVVVVDNGKVNLA